MTTFDTFVPVADLAPGDRVVSADARHARVILRFHTIYNPAFRPTVFVDTPHYASDLAYQWDINIEARADWLVSPDGAIDRISRRPMWTP